MRVAALLHDIGNIAVDVTPSRAVLDNAERELARARLSTARRYVRLAGESDPNEDFEDIIGAEFARSKAAILRIAQRQELLDASPVIRKSIALRNPYTDVLNLVQAELLRRWRGEGGDRERLRELLFLSINGIAAAMQSTG